MLARRSVLILLTVTLSASPLQAQEPDACSRLVERLKSGDRTVDFTELRMALAETANYNGMMMGVYRQLWA